RGRLLLQGTSAIRGLQRGTVMTSGPRLIRRGMITTELPCARPGCRKRERLRAVRREKMSQALEGIRVIDFTHDQAGPSCTQMLAWLGADVIKIERPPHGDRARRLWATPDDPADGYFFLLLNSNKRSIVVDLKTVEGKDIARRLVGEADV